jgi:hypothetical protein
VAREYFSLRTVQRKKAGRAGRETFPLRNRRFGATRAGKCGHRPG